jgi:hypothetical protein
MQFAEIAKRLRAKAAEGADIRTSCAEIFELEGLSWAELQREFDSGRLVLRGMPWHLREIDQNIHPWVMHVLSGLGFGVPIVTAIVLQSWWMLLMIPLFWGGMFLGNRSCLGSLIYIALVPLTGWAAYSGRPIVGACAGGLLLGAIGASFVNSFGRVFRALRTNETLFACFFGTGMVWIDDQTTGEQLRVSGQQPSPSE